MQGEIKEKCRDGHCFSNDGLVDGGPYAEANENDRSTVQEGKDEGANESNRLLGSWQEVKKMKALTKKKAKKARSVRREDKDGAK